MLPKKKQQKQKTPPGKIKIHCVWLWAHLTVKNYICT